MQHKLFSLGITAVLIVAVCCVGAVSAGGTISLDVPSAAAEIGQITTIPVTIHQAGDILGFKIYVPNAVTGAVITVNSSRPLDAMAGSSYDVNSADSRRYQVVSWAISELHGITGDAVLFYIDVLPSADAPSSIPLTIRVLDEMYDADFREVSGEYPAASADIPVNGGVGTAVVETTAATVKPTQSATPAVTPGQTSAIPATSVPIPADTAAVQSATQVSETLPPASSVNTGSVSPTASPVPLTGVLAGLGILLVVRRKNL